MTKDKVAARHSSHYRFLADAELCQNCSYLLFVPQGVPLAIHGLHAYANLIQLPDWRRPREESGKVWVGGLAHEKA